MRVSNWTNQIWGHQEETYRPLQGFGACVPISLFLRVQLSMNISSRSSLVINMQATIIFTKTFNTTCSRYKQIAKLVQIKKVPVAWQKEADGEPHH